MAAASDVISALAKRFAAPEHAFLQQVRSATGYDRTRTADAIAMGLYPSRGLLLHGIEVKVSRGDWLRELKAPAKAEEIARFCDRWWVAVSSADIVRAEELPPTWGLLVLKGEKMVQAVPAPEMKAEPVTRQFLASVLRNVSESTVPRGELNALVEKRVHERVASDLEGARLYEQAAAQDLESLRETVRAFEAASGVTIGSRWNREAIGVAVRKVLAGENVLAESRQSLQRARNQLNAAVKAIDGALANAEGEANGG